jgi:hypothetical protein
MPQSELLHIVKYWLWDGHIRFLFHPSYTKCVIVIFSGWGTQCTCAPSSWRMPADTRQGTCRGTLWPSCTCDLYCYGSMFYIVLLWQSGFSFREQYFFNTKIQEERGGKHHIMQSQWVDKCVNVYGVPLCCTSSGWWKRETSACCIPMWLQRVLSFPFTHFLFLHLHVTSLSLFTYLFLLLILLPITRESFFPVNASYCVI